MITAFISDMIKGSLMLAIYVAVLMATGFAFGKGCAAGLPVKQHAAAQAAPEERDNELDVDQLYVVDSNMWNFVWADAHN